jgi:hypothetical protein
MNEYFKPIEFKWQGEARSGIYTFNTFVSAVPFGTYRIEEKRTKNTKKFSVMWNNQKIGSPATIHEAATICEIHYYDTAKGILTDKAKELLGI